LFKVDKTQVLENTDFHAFYLRECGKIGATKENGNALTLCPFHDDSNPSLCVNIKNGIFNCFGCGAKGDVFTFVQNRHGLSFPDSVAYVAGTGCVQVKPQFEARPKLKRPAPQKKEHKPPEAPIDRENPSHIFAYCNIDGLITYYIFRWDKPGYEKTIRHGYYDEKGEIVLKMPPGVQRTLYNLQRADDYLDPQGRVYQKNPLDERGRVIWPPPGERINLSVASCQDVYLVEGEKCCDALTAYGFCATTSGNASSWKPEFAELLRGKNVTIIPDNDAPGEKYAAQAARDLTGIAASVRILRLEGLSDAQDVADWIVARGGL
jgi:hypothetical protein